MPTTLECRFAALTDNLRRSRARAIATAVFMVVFPIVLVTSSHRAAQAQSITNPYLYEIRKDGKVSWLFGTMHVGISYNEVRASLQPRIERSRVAYFELVDLDRVNLWLTNPVEAILTSTDTGFAPGRTLTSKEKQRLVEIYKIPSSIANTLTNNSCGALNEAFVIHEPRLDHQIIAEAGRSGKVLRNLDTDELREQAQQLNEYNRERLKPRKVSCDIAAMYLTGRTLQDEMRDFKLDVAAYRAGPLPSPKDFPPYPTGTSLRNHAWLQTLKSELDQGDVFIAVGVAHLYGEFGMLKMLANQGFEVERIR